MDIKMKFRKNWAATAAVWMIVSTLLFAACKPDPPVPEPETGTFQLAFAPTWGNAALNLSQKYPAPDGRNYQIDVLKYYVSRLVLLTPTDSVVNVKDVALVDLYYPDTKTISGTVPAGTYAGLRFNLGLDYDLNHSNQASYPTSHPLSTVNGMYWTWATQYIFSMIEGRADTTGGHSETIFLYHSGNDSLMRQIEIRNLNLVIGKDETKTQTLGMDLQKVFWSTQDTIDINVDPNTHTTDNPGLASRVTNQIVRAIQ